MDRSTRGAAGLLLTCRLSARGRHPTAQPSSRSAITSRPATSTLAVRPRLAAAYPHHRAASPHSKIDRAPLLVPNPNPRVLAPVHCRRLSPTSPPILAGGNLYLRLHRHDGSELDGHFDLEASGKDSVQNCRVTKP
ncbi:hypothetical protein PVAP13_4KG316505 [Panicum virgatum]|uniref:Uncharacterized protein n=1 Tax=Panicum virgatum TaxID=38727 RepID=A0A8T0TTZ9_PANVG|nr:hypothetical protein PVAP13_4KG316505 [Panicum virgatum]